MSAPSLRRWFCVGAATIAAAAADPVVESASNAGWFGRGTWTDHSNADVVPALAVGAVFLALYLLARVRALLGAAELRAAISGGVANLLPAIFTLQILALYSMETVEQLAVYGHALGPSVWLGGPPLASLALHAVSCVVVTFTAAAALLVLSERAAGAVRAFLSLRGARPAAVSVSRRSFESRRAPAGVRQCAGVRGPPFSQRDEKVFSLLVRENGDVVFNAGSGRSAGIGRNRIGRNRLRAFSRAASTRHFATNRERVCA